MRCAASAQFHDCSLASSSIVSCALQGSMIRRRHAYGEIGPLTRVDLSCHVDEGLPTCNVFLQADVATVLRDGRLHVIPASEVVPGDIVEIACVLSQGLHHAVVSLSAGIQRAELALLFSSLQENAIC